MTGGMSRRSFVRTTGLGAGIATAVLAQEPRASARAPLLRAPTSSAVALPDPGSIDATDPAQLSAVEAASLLQGKRLHPRELLDACLRRSAEFDGCLNTWVHTYPEMARDQAEQAARRLVAGDAPPICGLPIAMKDVIAAAGLPLTASSRLLEGNIAAGDATVWRWLREQGAVLMGHVHTDEFGLTTTCPQVGNPWDPTAIVGGSSGGSAAVVAARFAPLALGADTGGSLRIPASRCGVSAIKPTFGRVSKYGVIPVSWTKDHVGAMGRGIADAALLLSAIAGVDPQDPVTVAAPPLPPGGYPLLPTGGDKPLAGKRFGVGRAAAEGLPTELATLLTRFLDLITRLGGELRDITMPVEPTGLATGDAVETGAYHQQWADRIDQYSPAGAIAVGTALGALALPAADYWRLERDRARYQREYNHMLSVERLDAVVLPGVMTDRVPREETPSKQLESHAPVTWANYTGVPVLALPAGRSAATGLPFGVQLGGQAWKEAELIALGLELQAADPVWRETPTLCSAPRTLPTANITAPGPGPDPTNTDAATPAVTFVPSTA